jgi:hypothetical protein
MPAGTLMAMDDDPVIVNLLKVNFATESGADTPRSLVSRLAPKTSPSDVEPGPTVVQGYPTNLLKSVELVEREALAVGAALVDNAG